jgi:hypothetical protein
MITVTVGDIIKCNTTGHESAGLIGVLDRICGTEQDRMLGLGPDYGMVGDICVNLHNCIKYTDPDKIISYRVSALKEATLGAYLYTYYVRFPKRADWSYSIQATQEGWYHITMLWQEAGYVLEEGEPV